MTQTTRTNEGPIYNHISIQSKKVRQDAEHTLLKVSPTCQISWVFILFIATVLQSFSCYILLCLILFLLVSQIVGTIPQDLQHTWPLSFLVDICWDIPLVELMKLQSKFNTSRQNTDTYKTRQIALNILLTDIISWQ